jgi:hypothetical protein
MNHSAAAAAAAAAAAVVAAALFKAVGPSFVQPVVLFLLFRLLRGPTLHPSFRGVKGVFYTVTQRAHSRLSVGH